MSVRKNAGRLTATEKARFTAAVRQVKRYVQRWEGACLLALVGFLVVLPGSARAETCTMYEKYVKDLGSHASCVTTAATGYADHTPTGGSGILHARKVPYCPATGLDTGCTDAEKARSLDGTRGFYHLDVGSNATKWVFFLEGGGACGKINGTSAVSTCMDGSFVGVINDVLFYGYNDAMGDSREMTSKHARGTADTDFIDEAVPGNGILSDNGANPFSTSTRVQLAKTTFDRFMGNTTLTETYNGDSVKVYFHGRRLLKAMFKELDRPIRLNKPSTFSVNGERVPDLSAATQIIVAGNSGGAGGLIMNMEYIKDELVNIAPNARIIFVVASRMIPFLEAEAHFSNSPSDLYSDDYSGTSTMQSNSSALDATLTYSNSAFEANGSVRDLLSSWDPASSSEPFLDESCKTAHGHGDWRCFDEGHVALYHMDEDVFFYQGLKDSTHTNSSPLQWVTDAAFPPGASFSTAPWGGWLFKVPDGIFSGTSFSKEKSERVVYMAEQMWANHPGSGRVAFYAPEANCHTAITRSAFWADTMTSILVGTKSFGTYLEYWIDNYINIGNPNNIGAVDSNNTTEQFSGDSIVSSSMTCPP